LQSREEKMLNGMIESSRGCLKEEIRMDIISNNLANSTVIGFKKSRIAFQQILRQAELANVSIAAPQENPTRLLIDIQTDMSQGDIQSTGNPLDFAIFGKGFFKINTPDGIRYTRKGNFSLDSQGILRTQDGHQVMGKNGPIRIAGDEIGLSEQGFLSVDGIGIDQMDIVDFEDDGNLIHEGKSLFRPISDASTENSPPSDTRIKQGYVELSNVNVAEEMVQMIHSLRAFESYQKSIKVLDECNNRAINQVGKLK
jgi:flagellar basal-body rod protein FlgF